jgi:hypothetical protein
MAIKHTEELVLGQKFPPEHKPKVLNADQGEEFAWRCQTHKLKIEIAKETDPKEGPQNPDAPDNPFSKAFPLKGNKKELIQSGVPKREAKNQTYKYTARALKDDDTEEEVWDPHIIIL